MIILQKSRWLEVVVVVYVEAADCLDWSQRQPFHEQVFPKRSNE
jgi:hypothetical protein